MPRQKIDISAPAERVFEYVADISKHGEWGKPEQKLHVEKASEGPIGQGSKFKSTGQQFGEQHDEVTITEYAPSRRVVYESEGKAGKLRHWFEITPAAAGVELEKGFDIVKAGFPFVIFKPIVTNFIAPGSLKSDLERIKARVEAA